MVETRDAGRAGRRRRARELARLRAEIAERAASTRCGRRPAGRHAPAGVAATTRRSSRCRATSRWPRPSASCCTTAARLRAARPRLASRTGSRAARLRGGRAVAPGAAGALGQLAVSPKAGTPAGGRTRAERLLLHADRRHAAGAPELGRLGAGHRRRRYAPPLGRLAAARVRDARGAGDGHADRRSPLGRLRRDRPGTVEAVAGRHARAVRPRALRTRRAEPRAFRPIRTRSRR